MAGTHGDLFREIGALVVAAHAGQAFDLKHTSEELARCYVNLGVPADTIARAIARSMAAVGVSMEMLRTPDRIAREEERVVGLDGFARADLPLGDGAAEEYAKSPSVLFPSGVRVAVLS